jgi:hypothetical protein
MSKYEYGKSDPRFAPVGVEYRHDLNEAKIFHEPVNEWWYAFRECAGQEEMWDDSAFNGSTISTCKIDCSVKKDCLISDLSSGVPVHGVRGGLTQNDRIKLLALITERKIDIASLGDL